MKRRAYYIVALSLFVLGSVACEKNKSGPVATADGPSGTPSTEPPAVAKRGGGLYTTSGPAGAVTVGEPADVTLSVKPSDGFKINKDFRWNFEFQPNDAVEFAAAKVESDQLQLEDAGASIPVKVTAKSAGEHTVKATGNFSVCNDDKCELYRDQEVAFTISATDG